MNDRDFFIHLLGIEGNTEAFNTYIDQLESATGKTDALPRMRQYIETEWQKAMEHIGVTDDSDHAVVRAALQKEMEYANMEFLHAFQFPDLREEDAWHRLLNIFLGSLHPRERRGFFLRHDVAKELLAKHPPQTIIDHFGYAGVDELLEKEDIRHIYSALRFAVSGEWNDTFLQLYSDLTPDDFEEREIEFALLPADRWFDLAREFAKKKLHPFSHLKEMGLVFVVPNPEEQGNRDVFRILVTLILHYIFEVNFYARYFRSMAGRRPDDFGALLQQTIIGGIVEGDIPDGAVRITHQYYTKKENPDPRVFQPHVMPEPLHWHKGRKLLKRVVCGDGSFSQMQQNLCIIDIWDTCYTVGKRWDGDITSVNFGDNVVSNSTHKTYHLYEDIWTNIFSAFYSEHVLEQQFLEHMDTGMIPFSSLTP